MTDTDSKSDSYAMYLNQAEALLAAVEACCDRLNTQPDVDVDNQRSGGMVTLVFANRSQIVINLQKPLQEVWLAALAGGYHFRLLQGHWRDTKTGVDFFAELTRNASAQAGMPLHFTPL